ncbi:porin [Oceanicaulis sp. MMSF_3324]|uniref:porin n=1 Tax=Oceanicaulis sp. MMSF_3324 TaxID=3046702 RepID=UPI00273E2CC7|nr:porin [Oceanicaulis sp. MMSF_3324]
MAAPTAWGQSAPQISSLLDETELEFEADLDLLVGIGESHAPADGPYADIVLRGATETLTEQGWRYGVEGRVRLTTGDGRRGLARPGLTGPQANGRPLAGLLTGYSSDPGLDEASSRILLEKAQVYLQTRWVKLRAGPGETAAVQEASQPLHAFRLSRAHSGPLDPTGLNMADTQLSLADGATGVSVQSQRIIGFRVSASYAPQSDPCAQHCHPAGPAVLRADLKSVWSLAASFDRRIPNSGVRWSAALGYETASASGPVSAVFDDPWLVRADLVRQAGDLTVSVSGLTGSDGYQDADYHSLGFDLTYEQGDWAYGLELGYGRSDLVQSESRSLMLGASRLVGARGVLGAGVMGVREETAGMERNSVQLLVETGLRF